jgi:hypothetical protein
LLGALLDRGLVDGEAHAITPGLPGNRNIVDVPPLVTPVVPQRVTEYIRPLPVNNDITSLARGCERSSAQPFREPASLRMVPIGPCRRAWTAK